VGEPKEFRQSLCCGAPPDDLPNKTFETLKKFNLNTFGGENQSIKAEMEKLLASVTEKLCSVK
jgi:hypothetical protein